MTERRDLLDTAKTEFVNIFGDPPAAYGIAPGRVEVLGNHTDYNEGYVLAAAIDRHTAVVGRAIPGTRAKVYSLGFDQGDTFDITAPARVTRNGWMNYVQGVVDELRKAEIEFGAFEAVVVSDVPLGAGLSSSAAFEVATALFLQAAYPFEMPLLDLAFLCRRAENNFVGMNCGILDQYASCMGEADHLVYLDCRHLDQSTKLPLGENVELIIADTKAPHALIDGAYNRLQEDCFAAADHFARAMGGGVTHLRDVDPAAFARHADALPETVRKRARHIVMENDRVQRGAAALQEGDLDTMGQCMSESHESSREDFGNSCAELDIMVACAQEIPGCYGARLTGGGFGGGTVNLVAASRGEIFARQLASAYRDATGIEPEIHVCRAAAGARGGRI